jgi:hypothetical protein
MMNQGCFTFCQKIFGHRFSKKTSGQMTIFRKSIRSNELSVKWPFGQLTIFRKKLSVIRTFGQMTIFRKKISVKWTLDHMSFRSFDHFPNIFGQTTTLHYFFTYSFGTEILFSSKQFFLKDLKFLKKSRQWFKSWFWQIICNEAENLLLSVFWVTKKQTKLKILKFNTIHEKIIFLHIASVDPLKTK